MTRLMFFKPMNGLMRNNALLFREALVILQGSGWRSRVPIVAKSILLVSSHIQGIGWIKSRESLCSLLLCSTTPL